MKAVIVDRFSIDAWSLAVHHRSYRRGLRIRIHDREVSPPNGVLLVRVLNLIGYLVDKPFLKIVFKNLIDTIEMIVRHVFEDSIQPV